MDTKKILSCLFSTKESKQPTTNKIEKMDYFKEHEFRGQYHLLDDELKRVMDKYRHLWGDIVEVSNSPHAIGRDYGKGYHNHVLHGKIKAIDLIPKGMTPDRFRTAYEIGLTAGAGGIGIYPKWNQGPGIHLDVGPRGRSWSAYPDGPNGTQKYYGIERAFNEDV